MALRGILPLAFVSCSPASTSRIIDSRAICAIMETIVVLFCLRRKRSLHRATSTLMGPEDGK